MLSVPGAGLIDIIENTSSLPVRCPTIDGLISAGLLTGDLWNGRADSGAAGTCTTQTWKAQPRYQAFADVARWIVDPADGVHFGARLAERRIFIQDFVDDVVMPNTATDTLAIASGFTTSAAGDTRIENTLPPSAALSANPMSSIWLKYASTSEFVFTHSWLRHVVEVPE